MYLVESQWVEIKLYGIINSFIMKNPSSRQSSPTSKGNKLPKTWANNAKTPRSARRQKISIEYSKDNLFKVICPNCLYHFKIELDLCEQKNNNIYSFDSPQKTANLEQLIDREYSLISNPNLYSPTGFQASPILRLTAEDLRKSMRNKELTGLDKLKKLNQYSEIQKSRMVIDIDPDGHLPPRQGREGEWGKETGREAGREGEGGREDGRMDRSYEQHDFQDSRLKHSKNSMNSMSMESKQGSRIGAVTHSKLSGKHRFEVQCLLGKLMEWVTATQQLRSLPSYLRLLLEDYQLLKQLHAI